MKKIKSALIGFFVVALAFAALSTQPEQVRSINYELHPNEWYAQQARLWRAKIDKNPKNETAWQNYYNAVRYEDFVNTINTPEKKARLNEILEEMGRAIPDSYEYNYLMHKTKGNVQNVSYLKKAHQLRPDAIAPYYDLVVHYEITGEVKKVHEFYEKIYQSQDISPWLLNYNFNVLMSLEPNAILFTNGDNDTYPPRMLQEIKNIRPDVSIINISMSTETAYLDRMLADKGIKPNAKQIKKQALENGKFSLAKYVELVVKTVARLEPNTPLYLALTVYPKYFESLKDSMYIIGLAYQYKNKRINNLEVIQENLENNFKVDYLQNDWYQELQKSAELRSRIEMNYLPPMLKLMEYYSEHGKRQDIQRWQGIATQIAENAGNETALKEIQKLGE